jgi:hypothetical protein
VAGVAPTALSPNLSCTLSFPSCLSHLIFTPAWCSWEEVDLLGYPVLFFPQGSLDVSHVTGKQWRLYYKNSRKEWTDIQGRVDWDTSIWLKLYRQKQSNLQLYSLRLAYSEVICWNIAGLAVHLSAHAEGQKDDVVIQADEGLERPFKMKLCSQQRSNRRFFKSKQACFVKRCSLLHSGTSGISSPEDT